MRELVRLPTLSHDGVTGGLAALWELTVFTGAYRNLSRRSSEPRSFITGGQQLAWHVYRLEGSGDVETDVALFVEKSHIKGRKPSGQTFTHTLYSRFSTLSLALL